MAIVETEGIILSSMPHGESSKIVRIYSLDHGKVSVIAKGVKKSKKNSSNSLDPLNHVNFSYYFKETRDLHILSGCEVIENYNLLRSDLDKLSYSLAILENINKLVVEEEGNKKIFDLIIFSFNLLSSTSFNYYMIYWFFQFYFMKLSGYEIDLKSCRACGNRVEISEQMHFSINEGSVICENCLAENITRSVSGEVIQVLKDIRRNKLDYGNKIDISNNAISQINEIFDNYFKYHFEGYKYPEALKLLI